MGTHTKKGQMRSHHFLHNLCVQQNFSMGQAQSPDFCQAPTPSEKHDPSSVWADFFQSGHILYKAEGASFDPLLL